MSPDYARTKAAFLDLAELDEAARRAALDALQARDPELAARVVRQLEAAGRAHGFIDRSGDDAPRLARWRVLREVGRGGMGRVWLAERAEGDFVQRVALKQIDRDALSPDAAERLVGERAILAGLEHPHIARLLDGGVDARGRPYLATEYVDGDHLDRWCAARSLDVRGRVALLRDVARAVEYAHARLVVHRDIKPANILVSGDGVAKLVDFGIARRLDDARAPTAPSRAAMTLRYAAPEQVRGEPVGVGCDVYQLGVVLYELLALRSAYDGNEGAAALTHAILERDPVRPSAVPGALARIDADLDAICLRALRKAPADRYRGAAELADDLERWLAGEPVAARGGDTGYRVRRWFRRNWPYAAAASVLVALGVAHVLRLDAQLAQTQRERDRADQVAGFFVEMFRTATPGESREGEVTARDLLRRSTAMLEAPSRSQLGPEARAALLTAAGQVHLDLGLAREAEPLLARAVATLEAAPDAPPEALAQALRTWSGALYRLDRMPDYLAANARGIALLERHAATDGVLYAQLIGNVAIGHYVTGDAAAAWSAFDRAAALLARHPTARRDYVQLLNNVGGIAQDAGELVRARDAYTKATAALPSLPTPDRDLELLIQRNLAGAHRDLGELDRAARAYDDVIAGIRAFHGTRHEALVAALRGAGLVAIAQADAPRARILFDEAMDVATALYPPGHGLVVDIRGARAIADLLSGDAVVAAAALAEVETRRGRLEPLEAVAAAAAGCPAPDAAKDCEGALATLVADPKRTAWSVATARTLASRCRQPAA